jgi:HicA toxin of bacterial toxin-antitoxin,
LIRRYAVIGQRLLIYKKAGQPTTVVVPGQLGKDVPEGTLTSICRQAGIDKTTLKRGRQ